MEEENLKLKLLDLEKKFVELEMSVSKINESLKKLEANKLNEILERFEEIEDLVMIENAAVVELKELLEASATDDVKKELETMRREIEEKINSLNLVVSTSLSEIKENMSNLNLDFQKLRELEQRIEKVESTISNISKVTEGIGAIDSLREIVKNQEEALDVLKRDFEEIKSLRGKIEEELNRRIPSSLLEEFVKLGNELSLLKVNVSSLSRQLDEVYRDVKLLNPEMIRSAIAKITELKVDIEERVRNINELIASISSQREEIKKISLIEAGLGEISKRLNSLTAETEILRDSLTNFSTKKDLDKIKEELSSVSSAIDAIKERMVKTEDFEALKREFSSMRDDFASLKLFKDKIALETDVIKSSIQALTSRVEKIEELKNTIQLFSTKEEVEALKREYAILKSEISNISRSLKLLLEDRRDFVNRSDLENMLSRFVNIEDFSSLVLDFKKLQQEFDNSKHNLLETASRSEIQFIVEEIESLKDEISGVRKELINPSIIQQVVNKLSLLETRIAEIEKRIETKVKPIILE